MLSRFKAFLDDRLGLAALARRWLDAPVAGGARWSLATGAMLVWLLVIEFVTGVALATVYAPSAQTAWASVFYIQSHYRWGALVRGLHHWAAQVAIVLALAHVVRVVIAGAYKRPREFTWWLGLALLGLILAFTHTGALLPWDQRAYWTVRVEAGIASTVPVVGTFSQRMLQGGRDLGTLSITRLYAAHVGLLPALALLLVAAHVWLVRRNGHTPPAGVRDPAADDAARGATGGAEAAADGAGAPEASAAAGGAVAYWPSQAARNAVASLAVVALVLVLARTYGAPLDAPADPDGDYPARPEWFLLGLFKLRKMLEGGAKELVATVVLPGAAGLYLFALPFLDRGPSRALRDRAAVVAATLLLLGGVAGITLAAMRADARDPAYVRARALADRRAARARELAAAGVPPDGPLEMVRNDPRERPRELYAELCASCHAPPGERSRNARGPTLHGFGTRGWARAVLNDPNHADLFGRTPIRDMPSQARRLGADMDAVVEYLYAQGVEPGDPQANADLARRGDATYHARCTVCHQGEGDQSETPAEERDAPDLTRWASRDWIRDQVLHPEAPRNYGARNRMPAFGDRLQGRELEWVVDYVRGHLRAQPAPVVPPPPPPRPEPEQPAADAPGAAQGQDAG